MSIKEVPEKIKVLWGTALEYEKDIFVALLVVVVGIGGFVSGLLVQIDQARTPVRIETVDLGRAGEEGGDFSTITVKTQKGGTFTTGTATQVAAVTAARPATTGQVVGSKNGTKYHLPECPGAKRIKEENKVWFASIDEAKKAGYTAAANCPGLQ